MAKTNAEKQKLYRDQFKHVDIMFVISPDLQTDVDYEEIVETLPTHLALRIKKYILEIVRANKLIQKEK